MFSLLSNFRVKSSRNFLMPVVFLSTVFLFHPLSDCRAQETIAFDGLEFAVPSYAASGQREVVDGSLVLTGDTTDFAMDTDVAGRSYGDVSIRTQFLNSGNDVVGLYARSTLDGALGDPSSGHQLFAFIGVSGNIRTGQLVDRQIAYFQDPFPSGLDVTDEEIFLQLDVFDDVMSFTAWPVGTEMPAPQLTTDLSSTPNLVSEGRVGIWTFQQDDSFGPVAFRSITVVPEPSAHLLAAFSLLSLCLAMRRRNYRA